MMQMAEDDVSSAEGIARRRQGRLKQPERQQMSHPGPPPSQGGHGRKGPVIQLVGVGMAAAVVARFIIYVSRNGYSPGYGAQKGWGADREEGRLWDPVRCDIERVDSSTLTPRDFTRTFRGRRPVLLTGPVLQGWRALSTWSKPYLLETFGNRTIKAGMGSDIVNSGGGQGVASTTLADFINGLNSTSPDRFTFDVDFGTSLPELTADFRTPDYFLSFNGQLSRQRQQSWHMLSIGASRRGLPFHVHGETWIGLVVGHKRWFLFPPGRGLSTMTEVGHHPLMSVWHWFDRVLPRLRGEERPLQCSQSAGEVVYLPPGWKHLTLNVGETVGVGGQAVYGADQRLRDSLRVLRENPRDFEAHWGAGLSFAHKAMDNEGLSLPAKQQYLNQSISHFRKAAQLRPCQPEAHLLTAEVLLAMGSEVAYAHARSVIHQAQDLFSRADSPCHLPDYLGEEETHIMLAHVHLKFARFFIQAGDGKEAERALWKAIELDAALAPAYADLAYVFAREGRREESVEAMARASQLAPEDHTMSERFGEIQASLLAPQR